MVPIWCSCLQLVFSQSCTVTLILTPFPNPHLHNAWNCAILLRKEPTLTQILALFITLTLTPDFDTNPVLTPHLYFAFYHSPYCEHSSQLLIYVTDYVCWQQTFVSNTAIDGRIFYIGNPQITSQCSETVNVNERWKNSFHFYLNDTYENYHRSYKNNAAVTFSAKTPLWYKTVPWKTQIVAFKL